MLTAVVYLLMSVLVQSNELSGVISCGSVIKLIHKDTGNHLHSHSIAWGSGSGQQSVTTSGSSNDFNSMWLVKEGHNLPTCDLAAPIKCGSTISLEHAATQRNLHSHLFRAPLSGNQEVSGFGDGGTGDTGDNWVVECPGGETYWQRGQMVYLRHADTSKYLYTADNVKFNQQNCGAQCPIMGQTEVSAGKKDSRSRWMTGQGVYFPPQQQKKTHSEL